MIHPLESGGFVISAYGCWRPGVYEDERTARRATRLDDEVLSRLQDAAVARGGSRNITGADLDAERVRQRRAVSSKAADCE